MLATRRLEKLRAAGKLTDFCLIGGLAVSRWGYPRATADIDFAIALGSASLEELAAEVGGLARRGAANDPLMGSVSFCLPDPLSAVPIQLLQFPPAWEVVAFQQPAVLRLDEFDVPVVDWKALVLLKLYAGSALDLEDARRIMQANEISAEDYSYLRKKSSALRVSRKLSRLLKEK